MPITQGSGTSLSKYLNLQPGPQGDGLPNIQERDEENFPSARKDKRKFGQQSVLDSQAGWIDSESEIEGEFELGHGDTETGEHDYVDFKEFKEEMRRR